MHRLVAAARATDGTDARPFAQRVRDALDNDLDAPRALDAVDDLASAILSGSGGRPSDDSDAPATLRELGNLVGIDLTKPAEPGP